MWDSIIIFSIHTKICLVQTILIKLALFYFSILYCEGANLLLNKPPQLNRPHLILV